MSKKFFSRQLHIYYFYSVIPVIVYAEILAYILLKKLRGNISDVIRVGISPVVVFGIVSILSSVGLLIFQFVSVKYFDAKCKLNYDSPPLKIGSILVSEEMVLYFGMFFKRKIEIRDIMKAKYIEEYRESSSARYRYSYENKYIQIIRSGKKEIHLPAPIKYVGEEPAAIVNSINNLVKGKKLREGTIELYSEYYGDMPVFGLQIIIWVPIILSLKFCPVIALRMIGFVAFMVMMAYWRYHVTGSMVGGILYEVMGFISSIITFYFLLI